ncbi:MAG: serine/threonine-protein kinase [Planctomycetota bacterium]
MMFAPMSGVARRRTADSKTRQRPRKPLNPIMRSPDSQHDSRDPVEEIAERFIAQLRGGETTSIEEYQAAYPQYAEQIAALFPTLLVMEDVKPPESNPMRSRDSTDTLLERNLKRLGDYRIIRRIGYGGMGIVYEAEQESLGRRVAMKIFAPTLFSSPRQIRRFEREAQAAAKLHHSNLVPVLGVGEQWGIHYYIMQYIKGLSLDQILRGRGEDAGDKFQLRQRWNRIAFIGSQVADALEYAHSQEVLHRDIKPGNLILDDDGTPWITDFGLAKMMSQDDGATRTGQTVGTLRYMAPEQLHGKVDRRSDVYALGLTLYELLLWRPAYDESDRSKLVRQKTSEMPVRPRSLDKSIPRDLETIVMKAVAREPQHRYQTAAALRDDLQRFTEDLPIVARRVSPLERLYRWSRRNPALAAASGVAAMLALSFVLVTAWGYFRVQREMQIAHNQRQRAIAKEAIATGTLDHIFQQFGIESIEASSRTEPILSSEAAALLEELINYYDELVEDDSSDIHLRAKAAEAQMKVGNMLTSLGEYDAALAAYDEAYEKFVELDDGRLEQRLQLARLKNHRGQVLRILGEPADRMLSQAVAILDTALDELQDDGARDRLKAQLQYERARSLFLLASRIRPGVGPDSFPPSAAVVADTPRLERDALSRARLQEASEVLSSLAQRYPRVPAFRQLLARCLREQARDHLPGRDNTDQEAEQLAIVTLDQLVADDPQRLEYQFDLMETLAELSVFAGSLDAAGEPIRERLRRAIELGESLVSRRPDVTLYASALAHAHYKLAMFELNTAETSDPDERSEALGAAARHFREAVSRQSELIRRFPTATGYAAWQALFREQLAEVSLEMGDLEEAQYQVTAAIFLIEDLMRVSGSRLLDQLADQAYETLDAIFAAERTPPRLLPSRYVSPNTLP